MIRSRLFFNVLILAYFCSLQSIALAGEPDQAHDSETAVVCIAPFEDNTGDKKWEGLATGFSDLLAVTLSKHKSVNIVDRERLAELLKEQELSLRAFSKTKTASRVGKLLGADRIITGGVLVIDGKPSITAHVLDVATTQIVASKKVTGDVEDILSLSLKLASELGESLNIKVDPVSPDDYDKNPMASLHFMRGLGFYHAKNLDRAAMGFMACADLNPNHPTTHYWLGRCFHGMKEYGHAQIELRQFLKDFPESPQAPEAKKLLKECDTKKPSTPLRLGREKEEDKD